MSLPDTNLTESQAKALYESGWWKGLPARVIVEFQLFTERLCMPFGDFHAAVEEALGHSVWTHEFANPEHLQREFLGEAEPRSFAEVMALIPADKRIVLAGEMEP